MKKIRIGIIGPSEIAFRRFLPALAKSDDFFFLGVAVASKSEWMSGDSNVPDDVESLILAEKEKATKFQMFFGGEIYDSYEQLLKRDDIDAVYVPLPPLLHFHWGKLVLENNKHLLLEKPFTTSEKDSVTLNTLAQQKNLATHENFAFVFHKQLTVINDLVAEIGDIRLIRTSFGFPYRGANDFRYSKTLGGGALLDCGGYPIKLASFFLGDQCHVMTSHLHSSRNHNVDVYGSATLASPEKEYVAQISFGMDNYYKCDLEIWGSHGVIYAPRVFTPTAEMETKIDLALKTTEVVNVSPDDQFLHSLEHFGKCILNSKTRINNYKIINTQARLMGEVK